MNTTAIMKLTEFLPSYDGSTDVEIFILKINLILPQVPEADRPFFLTLLKLKLNGTAADYIAAQVCADVLAFIDLLRDRFQLIKKPEIYQTQLSQVRQNKDEQLSDFAARVMKIASLLNTAFAREIGIPLSPELIAMNARQAIKAFVDGFNNQELRTTLRLREFNNISEAITVAEELRARIFSANFDSSKKPQNPANTNNSSRIICNYCQKSGHFERDCRSKIAGRPRVPPNQTNQENQNNQNAPQRPPSNNPNPNYHGTNYNPNFKPNAAQKPLGNTNALSAEEYVSGNEPTQELMNPSSSCVNMN